LKLGDNEIGEIVVKGPQVTQSYFNRSESTALGKIADSDLDGFHHRMGDLGYRDDQGRIWFCGRKAHRVVTVSEFSKGEILEWTDVAPEKILVVHPGAGPAFTPSGSHHQEDRPYFLYVGNRKPHKNIGRMMRAFRASSLASDILLLLSGDRDEATVQLIREASLDESAIRFLGNIPDELMASYYRGAVAVLIPSLYEGFGLPALEAMACGTPVLAGNRASLPEVVGEAGLLVDPQDEAEISYGIRRIVEDSSIRETLSTRGLERARRFSWDLTAKGVMGAVRSASE
jgi:glycosyltransferase involved in cell wall biosynthesis